MRVAVLTRTELGVVCCRALQRSCHQIVGVGVDGDRSRVPEELRNEDRWELLTDWDQLLEIRPDLTLSADLGLLIPDRILAELLCINVHFALLPRYRGRHGVVWSLINGESEAGFTIHQIDSGIDTGPIYHQERTNVEPSDNVVTVVKRLTKRLEAILPDLLTSIGSGSLIPQPQDDRSAIYVAKRYFRDNYVDWNLPAQTIHHVVKALRPPYSPGAFTIYRNSKLFLLESRLVDGPNYFEIPGHVVARFPGEGIWVKTGDGVLMIAEVGWQGETKPAWEMFKTVGARLGIDWLDLASKVYGFDLNL